MTARAASARRWAKATRASSSLSMPRVIARYARQRGTALLHFDLLLAQMGQKRALAEADRFRRDLDELVVLDIGDGLLERGRNDRRQAHRFVLRMRADIGELLRLQRID